MFFSTGAAGAFLSSQLLCKPFFLCYPDKGISQRHPDVAQPNWVVSTASTPLPKPVLLPTYTMRQSLPHIPAPQFQHVHAAGCMMPQLGLILDTGYASVMIFFH